MAVTQKQERFAQAVADILNLRLATSSDPIPVVKAYDSNSDVYLAITFSTGNNSTDAIIRFKPIAAPASGAKDSLGLNQVVYTPGLAQVLFDSTAAVGTTDKVKVQVLAELAKLGQRVEVYVKAIGAANMAIASVPADASDASFVTAIEPFDGVWGPQAGI